MRLQQGILMGSLVALGATTFFVEPAEAADFGYGNFRSFTSLVSQTQTLTATATAQPTVRFDGTPKLFATTTQSFLVNVPVTVVAETYFKLSSSFTDPFDVRTDPVTVTTVWAQQVNPITGFDPVTPEIVPIGDSVFTGKRATPTFTVPIATTTLGALSTFLPDFTGAGGEGHDLSVFAAGDPTSIVYVSQVTVPAIDLICVPEPSALLSLLSLGLLGLSTAYKCQLQRKSIKSEGEEITRI